jgi:hypothetical protein
MASPSTKPLKAADEVVSYCTRCKLDLSHRIISMDGDKPHKVECQTCRSHHLYRRPTELPEDPRIARPRPTGVSSGSGASRPATTTRSGTGKSSSSKAVAAAEAENQRERNWEKRVSGHAVTDFKPYRISTVFDTNDLVHHAKFGDGYVVRVVDKAKIEIMFRDAMRTLAHGIETA